MSCKNKASRANATFSRRKEEQSWKHLSVLNGVVNWGSITERSSQVPLTRHVSTPHQFESHWDRHLICCLCCQQEPLNDLQNGKLCQVKEKEIKPVKKNHENTQKGEREGSKNSDILVMANRRRRERTTTRTLNGEGKDGNPCEGEGRDNNRCGGTPRAGNDDNLLDGERRRLGFSGSAAASARRGG
ncbi:hypothetical protein PIB30_019577 [Stylosanthes scabra]|uniref:Uncharacterized protein n=1 Tax=Stylosanthes scabra TaxID=79078 RepID=A0ABU6YA30_9FABA|nr:hypothetical protein [Stylosanthes scabra]